MYRRLQSERILQEPGEHEESLCERNLMLNKGGNIKLLN